MPNKALKIALLLALSLVGILALENRAVRADQDQMLWAYGSFLAKRVNGAPLSAMIRPGSLAVVRSEQGVIGCAAFR